MKAKFQIVPRPDETSHAAPGDAHAASQRERYRDELERELGIAPTGRRGRMVRSQSAIDWGTVTSTFILALLGCAAVFAAMLWRDGRLPRLWPDGSIVGKAETVKRDRTFRERVVIAKPAAVPPEPAAIPQEDPAPDISVTDLSRPAASASDAADAELEAE